MKFSLALVWLVLFLIGSRVPGQEDPSRKSRQLANFELVFGLADTLNLESTQEFLQLVDEQIREIREIKQKFVKRAEAIRDSKSLTAEEKLAKMTDLRKSLDEELLDVLLPHQKKLLAGYDLYNRVQYEGLVNSMLAGAIANHFKLSAAEIRSIKASAKEMFEEYRESQIQAQKRAIAELIQSFPKDKQDQLREMLEPMLDGNGLFYNNISRTFDIAENGGTWLDR